VRGERRGEKLWYMSLIDTFINNSSGPRIPLSPLNRYFDKILVINLRRSVARCIRVTEHLQQNGINFEIMNAVDGTLKTHQTSWNKYLEAPMGDHPLEVKQGKKLLTYIGEWGYLLTWKLLLRRALREGWKRFLVFEDDVILCHDFNNRVQLWLGNLLKGQGGSLSIGPLVMMLGATQLPQHRKPVIPGIAAYHPGVTDGSFAIGIDKQVVPELLEQVLRMDAPFDSGPLRELYSRYPEQCYVAWPHLVITDLDQSTIRQGNVGKTITIGKKLDWNLDQFPVKEMTQHRESLNFQLTIYNTSLTDIELFRSIKRLMAAASGQKIQMHVLLIQQSGSVTLFDDSTLGDKVAVYPRTIEDERLARRLGCMGKSNQCTSTYVFYNTGWHLDREILWVLPMLVHPG